MKNELGINFNGDLTSLIQKANELIPEHSQLVHRLLTTEDLTPDQQEIIMAQIAAMVPQLRALTSHLGQLSDAELAESDAARDQRVRVADAYLVALALPSANKNIPTGGLDEKSAALQTLLDHIGNLETPIKSSRKVSALATSLWFIREAILEQDDSVITSFIKAELVLRDNLIKPGKTVQKIRRYFVGAIAAATEKDKQHEYFYANIAEFIAELCTLNEEYCSTEVIKILIISIALLLEGLPDLPNLEKRQLYDGRISYDQYAQYVQYVQANTELTQSLRKKSANNVRNKRLALVLQELQVVDS